jgi:hypothetical protein
VKIRLWGTGEECRGALELLGGIMLVQSVCGPCQDHQRGEMDRSVLVRVYVQAIPRGGW